VMTGRGAVWGGPLATECRMGRPARDGHPSPTVTLAQGHRDGPATTGRGRTARLGAQGLGAGAGPPATCVVRGES
jgi:hypothetical protein